MVSGLAPGSFAETLIVGKSTRGKGATGKVIKAQIPLKNNPSASNIVATGLLINISENDCDILNFIFKIYKFSFFKS